MRSHSVMGLEKSRKERNAKFWNLRLYFRIERNHNGFTKICLQVFRCYVTHALSMQRCNDAFDLVHAFPRLLRKELPRERARARASCFIRRENEVGTDGGQRRERIELALAGYESL